MLGENLNGYFRAEFHAFLFNNYAYKLYHCKYLNLVYLTKILYERLTNSSYFLAMFLRHDKRNSKSMADVFNLASQFDNLRSLFEFDITSYNLGQNK